MNAPPGPSGERQRPPRPGEADGPPASAAGPESAPATESVANPETSDGSGESVHNSIDPAAETRGESSLPGPGLGAAAGVTLTQFPEGPEAPAPCGQFGRFELRELLGEGGMGRVFRAFDPRLRREVALKVLRSEDRRGRERLLREAQAQGRVDAPGICQIYETGEVDGRPYIAMQLIRGRPLHRVMGEMTLEERAGALAGTAEALHAAHREGLIHRDVKPANILAERDGDGRWRTVLCDFGLVRDTAETGLTETGAVLGTPGYTAPEQLLGRPGGVDRRADVYGLGATLYELLTGQAPFTGDSLAEALRRVSEEDPAPPRTLNRNVPPDLEAVALKCLEKDPARRYGSARELAEDLRRWLDGRPVTARRLTAARRLWRFARRRRWPVVAGAAMLLLTLGLLGYAWAVRARAEQEQELQTRFNLLLSAVAERLAMAYSRTPHDIGPETVWAAGRLPDIERAIRAEGAAAEGTGRYALGRALLMLGREEEALAQLRRAWAAGYRRPFVAYALGRALEAAFGAKLARTAAIADPETRAASRREIESQYRDEAVALLRRGAALPGEVPLAVPLALAERRYDDALAALPAGSGELRWPFEGPALRGTILAARADDLREHGDLTGALDDYAEADRSLTAALAVAPSYPEAHRARCRLRGGVLALEAQRGGDAGTAFAAAEMAAAEYLAVDPGDAAPWLERARIRLIRAQNRFDLYQYPELEDGLRRVLADADQAALRAPDSAEPHRLRAAAWRLGAFRRVPVLGFRTGQLAVRVEAEIEAAGRREPPTASDFHTLGAAWRCVADNIAWTDLLANPGASVGPDDPAVLYRRAFRKALDALERAVRLDPSFAPAHKDLGYLHLMQGGVALMSGADPAAGYRLALECSERALAVNPRYFDALDNAADALRCLAEQAMETGRDPRDLFRRAEAAFERDIRANPERIYPYDHLSHTYRSWTRHELRVGGDARAVLRRQRALLGRLPPGSGDTAGRVNDIRSFGAAYVEVLALLQEAEAEQELGGDAGASRREAGRRLDRLRRVPGIEQRYSGNLGLARSRLDLATARESARKGLSPDGSLAALRQRYPPIPVQGLSADLLFIWVEAELLRAEWRQARGLSPAEDVAAGLALLAEAMERRPGNARLHGWTDALVQRGRFRLARARWEHDHPRAAATDSHAAVSASAARAAATDSHTTNSVARAAATNSHTTDSAARAAATDPPVSVSVSRNAASAASAVADFSEARRLNSFQERPTEAFLTEARALATIAPKQVPPVRR